MRIYTYVFQVVWSLFLYGVTWICILIYDWKLINILPWGFFMNISPPGHLIYYTLATICALRTEVYVTNINVGTWSAILTYHGTVETVNTALAVE